MELKIAIEILEAFNAWRRYDGEEIQPYPYTPTDIGIALDVAIAALKTPPGPNWEEAPEWAQWWAMDCTGASCWYEKEPFYQLSGTWLPAGGNLASNIVTPNIEQRPTAKPPE
jgi:hypothetical protein